MNAIVHLLWVYCGLLHMYCEMYFGFSVLSMTQFIDMFFELFMVCFEFRNNKRSNRRAKLENYGQQPKKKVTLVLHYI